MKPLYARLLALSGLSRQEAASLHQCSISMVNVCCTGTRSSRKMEHDLASFIAYVDRMAASDIENSGFEGPTSEAIDTRRAVQKILTEGIDV